MKKTLLIKATMYFLISNLALMSANAQYECKPVDQSTISFDEQCGNTFQHLNVTWSQPSVGSACEVNGYRVDWSYTAKDGNNQIFTGGMENQDIDGEHLDVDLGQSGTLVKFKISIVTRCHCKNQKTGREGDNHADAKANKGLCAEKLYNDSNQLNIESEVSVYPNPSPGSMTVEFSSVNTFDFRSTVYSITGAPLSAQTGEAFEGDNKLQLDLSDLSSGVYVLEIRSDQFVSRKIFTIEK